MQRKDTPPDDAKILASQAALKDTDVEIPALEGALMANRYEASKRGLLSQASFAAGFGLSRAMTQISPAVAANKPVKKDLQDNAAVAAHQLFAALSAETTDQKNFDLVREGSVGSANTTRNRYTQESRLHTIFTTNEFEGWLAKLPAQIRSGQWSEAFDSYRQLMNGLDLWVADQLRSKGKGTPEEAMGNAQQHHAQLLTGLEHIADKHAKRLPALFHPDAKTVEAERKAGRPVAETVPMNVYYWQDAETKKYRLYDLTTPGRPHEQNVDGPPTAAMMNTFFEEVARYPEGAVRYTLPSGAAGTAPTTGKTKWYEWVGYGALVAAAIGLAVLSGGASLAATWCFAAGALAGGVSAAGHLADSTKLGTATTSSVVLDIAQIAGSILSAGAIGITIRAGGATAALANSRWLVPLTVGAAGADVVQLVALSDITFTELGRIKDSGGSPEDQQRAAAILLSQLAVVGGLTVLSVQGARNLRASKNLTLGMEGGAPVLRVAGEPVANPSQSLAKGYDEAVSAAGGYQKVSPEAIEALTEALPQIKVDPDNPTAAVAQWLTQELGAKPGSVTLKPLGSPGSGALVYAVNVDGKMAGVFKVFPDKGEMLREIAALQRLRDAGLKNMEAGDTSEASIVDGVPAAKGGTERGGAMLEPAKGHFVQDSLATAGKLPTGPERTQAVRALENDVRKVAQAMAEMHDKLASGTGVAKEMKEREIGFLAGRWDRIKSLLPAEQAAKIEAGLARVKSAFRAAKLDATVAHGDAHTGNFAVQDNGKVSVIDTETLYRSINSKGEGQSPAAIDVGRYYESLHTHSLMRGLTASEAEQLQQAFIEAYRAAAKQGGGAGLDAAMTFYQANWELIILAQTSGKGEVGQEAAARLAAIVGAK